MILGTGLETTAGLESFFHVLNPWLGSVSGKAVFTVRDALLYREEGIATILVSHSEKTFDGG
jgi:hypothetical protein